MRQRTWSKWMNFSIFVCMYSIYVWACLHVWPHTVAPGDPVFPREMASDSQWMNPQWLSPVHCCIPFWNHNSFHLNGWRCQQLVVVSNRAYTYPHLCFSACVGSFSVCVCVCQLWGGLLLYWLLMRLFVSSQGYQHSAEQEQQPRSLPSYILRTLPLLTSHRCSISGYQQFGFLFTCSTRKNTDLKAK